MFPQMLSAKMRYDAFNFTIISAQNCLKLNWVVHGEHVVLTATSYTVISSNGM